MKHTEPNFYGQVVGKVFDREHVDRQCYAYVGMNDAEYKSFCHKKEAREKAIAEAAQMVGELSAGNSYYINDSGMLQMVHFATSYQLLFYCGTGAVIYVLNTEYPPEALQEKLALLETCFCGTGIHCQLMTGQLYPGQFATVDVAMQGKLEDFLNKLPYTEY